MARGSLASGVCREYWVNCDRRPGYGAGIKSQHNCWARGHGRRVIERVTTTRSIGRVHIWRWAVYRIERASGVSARFTCDSAETGRLFLVRRPFGRRVVPISLCIADADDFTSLLKSLHGRLSECLSLWCARQPHDTCIDPWWRIKLEVQDAIRGPWGAAESERRSEDGWR